MSGECEIRRKRFITFILIGLIIIIPVVKIGVNEFRHYQNLENIKSLPLTVENLTGTYVSFNSDLNNAEKLEESFAARTLRFSPDGVYDDLIVDKDGEHKMSGVYQIIDNQVIFQTQDHSETLHAELKENTDLRSESDEKFVVLNLYSTNTTDGDSIENDQEELVFSGIRMGVEE